MNPRNWLVAAMMMAVAGSVAEPLPGTARLEMEGDLAAEMVAGLARYLDRAHAEQVGARDRVRAPDRSSEESWVETHQAWVAAERERLVALLGLIDAREPVTMRYVTRVEGPAEGHPGEVGRGPGFRVFAVVWNVFRGVEGEGLLLVPEGPVRADVIAVPDCDWTPEQGVGLAAGLAAERQFPRRFAAAGCRVLVPFLIDRGDRFAGNPGVRSVRHSQRETLWRAGYQMGRQLLGYEVQKVLAAADWMQGASGTSAGGGSRPLAVVGYGEGGLVALYAGALDARFDLTVVSGAFGLTDAMAALPIYRNVWAMLERFGDAELAGLIAPRRLIVEAGDYPEVTHTDRHGGAPGQLWRPSGTLVEREFGRALDRVPPSMRDGLALELPGAGTVLGRRTMRKALEALGVDGDDEIAGAGVEAGSGWTVEAEARLLRQYRQILEDTQHLMRESEYVRREFWSRADFRNAAAFGESTRWYRDYFRTNVVGMIPPPSVAGDPRSRLLYETNGIRGYEVVLGVHPDVFAHGILVLPAGLKPGDRRPVVVCQHGLEGRPTDLAHPEIQNNAYHRYAFRLAEQGWVTFSPQNPYIGGTTFRQVQRQAQPLGLTLWSFMVRQHEVITGWLAAQDFVDPARIAFYGLSYGGKTAMRVPVLVDRYCLSICSADFNEWIWKNVSARARYSYLWTIEYDMAEWNLGNTFNYAEMSWLIFPRPFMVERGHDDGVAPDEWVAYEFARTRRHYVKLGFPDRAGIEFFDGPHAIHGEGTFRFLERQLGWPPDPGDGTR